MSDRKIPLSTYNPRAVRSAQRRAGERKRALVAVAALLMCVLVAVAVLGATRRTQAARPSADGPKPANRAVETSSPANADARSSEASVAVTPSEPPTLTIAAVGDMIFDRKVKALVASQGGEAPLAAVASRLAGADVTVGNLESTLSDGGTRNTAKDVTFRGHPEGIRGLRLAGFDLLSMANNHVLDYGAQPLLDTVAALDSAGIGHAGAGANQTAAWEPAVIERDGATVAYLAFSHIVPAGFIAQPDRAGLASGKNDEALTLEAIRRAAAENDYVLVSFHWGVEYQDDANGAQVTWAHKAIDAGADMVLAHHPHVIQGIERYNGGLIAYSLGDFVFDHYSRKTGEAFILEAELGPHGVANAVAVPVYLDGNGKPEFVDGSSAASIIDRLSAISKKLGTTVATEGSTGRVLP